MFNDWTLCNVDGDSPRLHHALTFSNPSSSSQEYVNTSVPVHVRLQECQPIARSNMGKEASAGTMCRTKRTCATKCKTLTEVPVIIYQVSGSKHPVGVKIVRLIDRALRDVLAKASERHSEDGCMHTKLLSSTHPSEDSLGDSQTLFTSGMVVIQSMHSSRRSTYMPLLERPEEVKSWQLPRSR